MKAFALLVAGILTVCFSVGCGGGGGSPLPPTEEEVEQGNVKEEAPKAAQGSPSSEEVVQAFRDAGLEVGDTLPVDQAPTWAGFQGPKTYQEGIHFELPSLGQDESGQVFTYGSRQDLEVMKNYWENLNENGRGLIFSWVYDKGNTLVHLSGKLPKDQADRYGEVLEGL